MNSKGNYYNFLYDDYTLFLWKNQDGIIKNNCKILAISGLKTGVYSQKYGSKVCFYFVKEK